MTEQVYHIPALLSQTLEALDIKPDGIYLDATFGGGGHSRAIVDHLSPAGHLYGFDQDLDAIANDLHDERFTFVRSNFRYAENFMRWHGVDKLDGILADLGVSFHHFDTAQRGFSFRADAPLDMRMNTAAPLNAATIVNDWTADQIADILYIYGEIRDSRRMASAIVKSRTQQPIISTGDLLKVVEPMINPKQQKKELAQVFQALRIAVNGEMQALQKFLQASTRLLRPGGRIAVLTYHSLEDRMVKNFMRAGNIEGHAEKDFFGNLITPWKLITRQPIVASAQEVAANPRARSAKLRVAELIKPEK